MSFDTFKKVIEIYKICQNKNDLLLHNFGEVTLHPHLPTFLKYAKDNGIRCTFFTNGVYKENRPIGASFWANLHRHGLESVNFSSHILSIEEFQSITQGIIRVNRVFDPKNRKLGTWAGQTGPPEVPVPEPCIFEREKAFVVLWDGRISSCCLDVEGRRSELWIDDILKMKSYEFEQINLCNACSSMRHFEEM